MIQRVEGDLRNYPHGLVSVALRHCREYSHLEKRIRGEKDRERRMAEDLTWREGVL